MRSKKRPRRNSETDCNFKDCTIVDLQDFKIDTSAIELYREGMERCWNSLEYQAFEFLHKAADMNYPPAFVQLTLMYRENKDDIQSNKYRELSISHKEWFVEKAKSGIAEYQYMMCLYADIIDDDKYDESQKWAKKAADQKYAPALVYLGLTLIVQGNVTPVWYYEQAAELGYPRGVYFVGDCYEEAAEVGNHPKYFRYGVKDGFDTNEALIQAAQYYQQAAEAGYIPAMTAVGHCYLRGRGVEKDLNKALYWIMKAAARGYLIAYHRLGRMYEDGKGVPQDWHQAFEWYLKAAKLGHTTSQYDVGWCYKTGNGVGRDIHKAIYWYQTAAQKSHKRSQCALGKLSYDGQHVKQDFNTAVMWFEKATNEYPDAQLLLGRCYEYGEGVPQDINKAIVWIKKATTSRSAPSSAHRHLRRIQEVNQPECTPKEET